MKKLILPSLLFSTMALALPPKWTSLFDGKTIKGWHSYHKDGVVGWYVEDGAMTPDGTGGDLVTDKEYENFELEFEFKIPKGSNSGVVYKLIDSPDIKSTYMSGPEYQVIDDKGYLDGEGKLYKLKDTQLSGANYDMLPPSDRNAVKTPGEWNKGRIVVNKNHVEHYLNGVRVVDYEYGTDAWKAMVAKVNLRTGRTPSPTQRQIALQNHSPRERVWYRAIQIREL